MPGGARYHGPPSEVRALERQICELQERLSRAADMIARLHAAQPPVRRQARGRWEDVSWPTLR